MSRPGARNGGAEEFCALAATATSNQARGDKRMNHCIVGMGYLNLSSTSVIQVPTDGVVFTFPEVALTLIAGLNIGGACARARSGLAGQMLFGVTPADPGVFALAEVALAPRLSRRGGYRHAARHASARDRVAARLNERAARCRAEGLINIQARISGRLQRRGVPAIERPEMEMDIIRAGNAGQIAPFAIDRVDRSLRCTRHPPLAIRRSPGGDFRAPVQ
jgi:hypothetical protein